MLIGVRVVPSIEDAADKVIDDRRVFDREGVFELGRVCCRSRWNGVEPK